METLPGTKPRLHTAIPEFSQVRIHENQSWAALAAAGGGWVETGWLRKFFTGLWFAVVHLYSPHQCTSRQQPASCSPDTVRGEYFPWTQYRVGWSCATLRVHRRNRCGAGYPHGIYFLSPNHHSTVFLNVPR